MFLQRQIRSDGQQLSSVDKATSFQRNKTAQWPAAGGGTKKPKREPGENQKTNTNWNWFPPVEVTIIYGSLVSDLLPRLEETENTTDNYRARTAELRRDILENKTEKERTENSLESARDTLNQVRAAREEAEELWREKYLLNQSERLEERNRVKDLLAQVRALLSYQTISHLYQVISVKAAARCRTSKSAECFWS